MSVLWEHTSIGTMHIDIRLLSQGVAIVLEGRQVWEGWPPLVGMGFETGCASSQKFSWILLSKRAL